MFTEFHGLSESPFTIMPNPRLAWLGSAIRKVRAEVCNAVLEGRGLVVLSGGPGVGKSLALTLLASDLKQSGVPYRIHALNCGLQVSATELLRRVAEDAADDDHAPATDRLTVLLIDEAQHLGSAELGEFLQETALRGDRLHLVLAGAPELELAVNEALAQHPGMVAAHWSLEPLPLDEISSYIDGRLHAAGGGRRKIFTADAIECLARHSGGVPRRLNVLCSTALFLAWSERRQDIDASIVEAALPALNLEPLTDAAEPPPLAGMSMSPQRPLIQAAVLLEAKGVPMAELESAAPEDSAEPTISDGVRSEVMEFVTARVETCDYATNVGVAATPVSREIAQLQPKAKATARQHRLVMISKWAQLRCRPALFVPVAAAAAIVFLLVAIDWRTRDERPAGDAIAPMTALTIPPSDPPIIVATNQSTVPSQSPSTVAAEPVLVEESPAPVTQRTNDPIPENDGQMASAAEPVDPLPVHTDVLQFAEEGPPSAVERRLPPEIIGPVEVAELLARARQQIDALALTTPAGDNAFETLQRVLAAMPAQPDALQCIHDIASKYALLAAQAKRRGELGLAKRYLDKGLEIVPDHPDLLAVQQKLAAQYTIQPGTSQSAGTGKVSRPATSGFARVISSGTTR